MESYKTALHEFALSISGKAGAKNFSREFVEGLLACFGWDETPGLVDHTIELEGGETHETGLWWPERKVMIEVRKPYVMLAMAWPEVLKSCLAIKPLPRYVVFTNRRELHLYDTKDAARDKPLLAIELEHLPKYSENFAFLKQDWDKTQGIGYVLNVEKVSKEVADRVGVLYRSLIDSGTSQDDAVKFTLQCIITMFAEDIGLLPKEELTLRLYRAQKGESSVREMLTDLFTQMATKPTAPRKIRYFNGGLFTQPVVLDLDDRQLKLLTKAAEANWKHVDPHIFGSVFQSIMSDAERHATGAHYTAKEDIMLVVGPTIVEPWRKKIQGAKSLTELKGLREELGDFKVLDPACGSGNFLYIAYRELYRLETELLSRMRNEFPKSQDQVNWTTVIKTTNFFGIDLNPFAVELARTTLNIAKKIAYDERLESIGVLYMQIKLVIDPSLPLDNLNDNIFCDDALFCKWPDTDTIVGNPPFLGTQKIRENLTDDYVDKLSEKFGEGLSDLCTYWFVLAHKNMRSKSRAGFVATSSIKRGSSNSILKTIIKEGGTIFHAVSSADWSGEANVKISIVNWINDEISGPFQLIEDGIIQETNNIISSLKTEIDTSKSLPILANSGDITSRGVIFGHSGFKIKNEEIKDEYICHVKYVSNGTQLLSGKLISSPDMVIDLRNYEEELDIPEQIMPLLEKLRKRVKPRIERGVKTEVSRMEAEKERIKEATQKGEKVRKRNLPSHFTRWIKTWWMPRDPGLRYLNHNNERIIVCSNVASRPIYNFLSKEVIASDALQMFFLSDDYSFGLLQSSYHWEWTMSRGGRLKNEDDIRYNTGVWKTFPWPQAPTEEHVSRIGQAAQALRRVRDEVMAANNWSLRKLYQSAEEADSMHPLNLAQAELDAAVQQAYGHPSSQSIVEFLLELNQNVAQDEKDGYEVLGPGLPEEFDPTDSRWMSTDCITPPPFTPSSQSATL